MVLTMHLVLRRALALAVAALFVASPTSAQGAPTLSHADVHVLTLGPDGATCSQAEEASLMARLAMTKADGVRLTPLPSLNPAGSTGFRIILRATDQLLANPEALIAFRRSAARWEQIIQTPVTTVIDVDFGPLRFGTPYPSPNILGSTGSAIVSTALTPVDVVGRLKERTNDAQLLALYDAIPIPTPSTAEDNTGATTNLGRMEAGLIPRQVLGLSAAQLSPDPKTTPFGTVPTIGFNASFVFDFDPRDGVRSNAIDFEGVAIHEIGHALGFVSVIGRGGPPSNLFSPWDLFRVRPEDVTPGEPLNDGVGWEVAPRVVTPGPPNSEVIGTEGGRDYFAAVQTTFDGLTEYETSTATGAGNGGDGNQASHWRDDALRLPSLGAERKIGIMDPNLNFGRRDEIEFPDIRLLEIIGYDVIYEPAFAEARFSLDGVVLDTEAPLVLSETNLGDTAGGGTGTATLRIDNVGATTDLQYTVEFVPEGGLPLGTQPTVSVSTPSGTVAPGQGVDLTLTFSAPVDLGFYFGRLLLRTNDESQLVVDLPVAFSVGGAREPELSLDGTVRQIGDLSQTEVSTFDLTIRNVGSFPVGYTIEALLTPQGIPFDTDPTARRGGRAILFQTDFDANGGIENFLGAGTASEGWRETRTAPATEAGHSIPTAVHFGFESETGSLGYRDNTTGLLLTPSVSLVPYDLRDVISVEFNYYLDIQEGDVAALVYSFDNGATFETITTSEGGLLVNDATWRSFSFPASGLAGSPGRVRFGFLFLSDGNATATGWLIDDVSITVDRGATFFASALEGTVDGDATETVTFTVDGRNLPVGLYTADITVEPVSAADPSAPTAAALAARLGDLDPISVEFTVGAADLPSLVATPVSVDPGIGAVADFSIDTRNPSSSGVTTYLRVVEPALRSFETEREGVPAAPVAVEPQASVVLPGARFPFAIAQIPDGRVLVSDVQTNGLFVVAADLSSATAISGPAPSSRITGLAWNPLTESLWATEFDEINNTFAIREGVLGATAFTYTGNEVEIGFAAAALAYSAELDVYFTAPYQSDEIYAYGSNGEVMPGYPFLPEAGLDNQFPALDFRNGVLEFSRGNDVIRAAGQFGRPFDDGADIDLSNALVGASSVRDFTRSLDDPEGRAFLVTSQGSGNSFRVVQIDPPDFPDYVGTRVFANEPLGGDQAVAPGEAVSFDLRVDARGRSEGFDDEVVFLVNNPTAPLVRFPVAVNGGEVVAGEDGPEGTFAVVGAVPNPVGSGGAVRFRLAEAADVTVTVFNVLGQRVAVLAERQPLAAGTHDLPLRADGLAAGTYLVRVDAGRDSGARTLTVVR